ncbi:hypothetical protein [Salininema proteolyticum]|uniref:Excreted virulence factor EspC, type VII ESX diderm n=1 Tax=Salininema proteolyticum TaxID=1607685 RepID=A0ABV8TUI6_9ACTN
MSGHSKTFAIEAMESGADRVGSLSEDAGKLSEAAEGADPGIEGWGVFIGGLIGMIYTEVYSKDMVPLFELVPSALESFQDRLSTSAENYKDTEERIKKLLESILDDLDDAGTGGGSGTGTGDGSGTGTAGDAEKGTD